MSRSKAKGTRWESAIVAALQRAGFEHAERRAGTGAADRGDITGLPGLVIEAKDCGRMELGVWVNEAAAETVNAGARYGVVWHHRKNKSRAEDGYVTMSGANFLRLLQDVYLDGEVST